MKITAADTRFYALTMRRPVRELQVRSGWILRLRDDTGRSGHGDLAPWPGLGTPLALVEEAIERLSLEGLEVNGTDDIESAIQPWAAVPELAYAIELALLDLLAQTKGLPIAKLLSPSARKSVDVNSLGVEPGAQCVKLKVGGRTIDEEVERVAAARATLGPKPRIRLDANGAWERNFAVRAIKALAAFDLEWVEQPVSTVEDLAWVQARSMVPIAVDETVRNRADLDEVIETRAAQVLVLKPALVGGLLAAGRLAVTARDHGMRVCVTSLLESAVGRTGALHLAASLPEPLAPCGLSHSLIEDLALLPPAGELPGRAGLGLELRWPDPNRVPNPVASTALSAPDSTALVSPEQSWTARELMDQAARIGRVLAHRGVGPGARVALNGARDARFVLCLHGIGWVGASVVCVSGDPSENAELSHCFEIVDLLEQARECDPLPEREWPLSEVRFFVHTSGTSGSPRLVSITTAQVIFGAFGSAIRLGHDPDDRWLCCLPLHHVGGLAILYRCALYGTRVVFQPRFDAAEVSDSIDSGEVTMVSLVPTMLSSLLDARQDQPFPASLRVILLGGAAPSAELLSRCATLRAPISVTWGMSEAGSQVATRRPGALGNDVPPLPFARVSAIDGALLVRGPQVGGALLTGDAGFTDERGWVHIRGRRDDVIISGGENIDPARVERILRAHPAVRDVAVVAVEDPHWGQRPEAVVVTTGSPHPDALRSWCTEHLHRFEIPDRFEFVDALPRDGLGKLSRARVRGRTRTNP